MNLKRTIYHVAGKDYEATKLVEFNFHIQRVSIENFLNLPQVRYHVKKISGSFFDPHHTKVDAAMKTITVQCMAETLANILALVGVSGNKEIEKLELWVRNIELRAKQSVRHERYDGIHVFDPKTKKAWLTSNTPKKIEGRQAIINGKLWRKYITA